MVDEQSGPTHGNSQTTFPSDGLGVRYHLVILILATSVLVLAALLSEKEGSVFIPFTDFPMPGVCTFKSMTGLDCPGCGLTRSFVHLVRANFARAWQFNPAGILVFAVVVFQVPYRSIQLYRNWKSLPRKTWGKGAHLLWFVVIGLFAQWISRLVFRG